MLTILAFCQNRAVASPLIVAQSPPDGGTVTPGMGVFKNLAGDESILVRAKPKQGYRFLYWLGDVADSSALQTSVLMDKAKMVVAVYERDKFSQPISVEAELPEIGTYAPGGGGGRSSTPISPRRAAGGSSGGGSRKNPSYTTPTVNPVPEPMTVLLLASGGLMMRRYRRRK